MPRRLVSARASAFLALGLALTFTLAAWALSARYVEGQAAARFESDADELEIALHDRMSAYEQVLLGGVGLFHVNGGWVSREQWREYYGTLGLEERFPGMQGFGFSERVEPANLTAHVERVRGEGFPSYAIYPEGERAEYSSAIYIEPFTERNLRAFGFDMYSEPVRREAMAAARDTGSPVLSGKVRLVQENGTDVQPGFLLYAPVYRPGAPVETVEERREALVGWVYAPFRARDFMAGVQSETTGDLLLRIYDDDEVREGGLLYDTTSSRRAGDMTRTSVVGMAGRDWTLIERSTPVTTPPGLSLLPLSILLGGLLASALLFVAVWSLALTRERAEAMALDMTGALRTRTRELEERNEALRAFSYVVSHDLKEPVRGIDGYLRILREDHERELSPEARRMLASAQAASDRLGGLLRGLLELSRMDRGLLTVASIDVAEVVAQDACRSAYETLQRERGAQIDVEPSPRVLAAPSVLAQALGNLLANAIRHNPSPAPRVVVRGRREGDLVEVSIEDDGPGFPEGLVAAFERGEQVATGFGLLIAQRATERLHGRLLLGRSERLGGASVRLILPAAPEAAAGDAREGAPRTPGWTSASR